MLTKLQAAVLASGLLVGLAALPVFAQAVKSGKPSDSVTDPAKIIEMLSLEEKAAMIDHAEKMKGMTADDKAAYLKAKENKEGEKKPIGSMSTQEKAGMFDKMSMEEKVIIVNHAQAAQNGGKKDNVDKKTAKPDKR